MFRKKETLNGFELEPEKGHKGRIEYNQKKCKKHYKCVKYCPAVAISVRPDKFIKIDHEKCIRCGLCVEVCPEKALRTREK